MHAVYTNVIFFGAQLRLFIFLLAVLSALIISGPSIRLTASWWVDLMLSLFELRNYSDLTSELITVFWVSFPIFVPLAFLSVLAVNYSRMSRLFLYTNLVVVLILKVALPNTPIIKHLFTPALDRFFYLNNWLPVFLFFITFYLFTSLLKKYNKHFKRN